MIERYEPGWRGMPLGIKDRNGVPIHVGDTLEFDKEEFGRECIFEMEWDKENCEPSHPGARGDLSEWCRVIKHHDGSRPLAEGEVR